MYNGYEFQGRILRVHYDRSSLPLPHPQHNPPPHPVHLAPPHVHRPPPQLIPNLPHNFHLGPPIHPHFISPAHMGPFSPPLATPPLTSPPPFPTTYNPLAHHNNQPNSNPNGSTTFQPMQIIPTTGSIEQSYVNPSNSSQEQTTPGQFPGFGPIGKVNNHSPPSTNTTSSISNLGAVGYSSVASTNATNGIVGTNGTNGLENNYGTGNDNALNNLTSSFGNLHLSQTPQQLFFHHPAHPHPHHRPPIHTAYHPQHHHQVAIQQPQQQHNNQHQNHPGAIGSGMNGLHIQGHANGTSCTTANGLSSVIHLPNPNATGEADNSNSKNNMLGSSTAKDVNVNSNSPSINGTSSSIVVPSPGLWDNGASAVLSSTNTASTGANASNGVMSLGMATTLNGMGGSLDDSNIVPTMVIPTVPAQSVFIRHM